MMQMNKAAMQKIHNETDRLLGDETGAGDDIPKSVIVRRNKKKNERRKKEKSHTFQASHVDYSPARKWLSFELVGKMYVRTSFLLKYVGSVATKGCAWQDSHENSFCGTHTYIL